MKLQKIGFIFENCESFEIDGKYVGDFHIGDVEKVICRVACNAIEEVNICNSFRMEINKDADGEYSVFGTDDTDNKFDRLLRYNDITHIKFILIEPEENGLYRGQQYMYAVPYEESDGLQNVNQFTYRSDLGHLYIIINKDLKLAEDYELFDTQIYEMFGSQINDSEYMDSYFRMLGAWSDWEEDNEALH